MDLFFRCARRLAAALALLLAPVAGSWAQDEHKWSDPATWADGTVPDATTQAVIPAGQVVLLDTHAVIKTLTIEGELRCLGPDLSLTAEQVMVHGLFQCGSPESPFLGRMTLTLTGPVGPHVAGEMGYRVLGAMMGGTIQLHGEPRVSWTQLAATAPAGAASLVLARAVDWRVGDQIVLAPTRDDVRQGEVVTVTAVIPPATIQFTPPLLHTHWGEATIYSNGVRSWRLDERAEVGLLSRNLKIQGDAGSETNGLGGHIMTMAGTTIHASGIELYRMGQKGLLGRYPFHWHLLGDAPGQSIVNSSIHHSFNRCVTVHGTNGTLVQDNVCYDFLGHGYFLEDGGERGNVFDGNLGIWAKKPRRGQAVVDPDLGDSDTRSDQASNGPAVFWISNAENTYTGNAAAGSEGTGFWYRLEEAVGEPSLSGLPGMAGYNPRLAPFGTFADNRVHSSRQGFSSCTDGGGARGLEPPGQALIRGLTVSNTGQAVWPCSPPHDRETHRFSGLVVANSANGFQAPNPMLIEDSLFVAYSANTPPGAEPEGGTDWRAIQVYDQGFHLENVHFVHYDRPAMTVFLPGAGAHKLAKNRGRGLTFDNSPHLFLDPHDFSRPGATPDLWGDVVHDRDGSFVGNGFALVNDHPIVYDSRCIKPLDRIVAGYACPLRYANFRGEHFSDLPALTLMRSDGVRAAADPLGERSLAQVVQDGGYHYTWRYDEGVKHAKIELHHRDAWPGDTMVYEILDMPACFTVMPGGGSTAPWSEATGLADLMMGDGHRYFYREHSLFLKMVARGERWHASDIVEVYPRGNCPAGASQGTLPTVRITSPADGARVPAGSPVTFTAEIDDPDGIQAARLYLGTRPAAGPVTAPPYTWTLPGLAAGRYAVKLMAEDTTGQTWTAVQQLLVGETGPRVAITSVEENQSFDQGVPIPLVFTLGNWVPSPGGPYLQLLVDDRGVDKVENANPILVSHLEPGRHEVELALAEPGSPVTAISDRRTIYVMASDAAGNKTLADFEDGVDIRSRLTADDADIGKVSPLRFDSGTADPEASRADSQDDLNHFEIENDGLPYGRASYRLKLDPPQSWAAFSRLELVTGGLLPFEVLVVDAAQGETSLGRIAGSTGIVTTALGLPGSSLIDQVTEIRLLYREDQVPSPKAASGLYSLRLLR